MLFPPIQCRSLSAVVLDVVDVEYVEITDFVVRMGSRGPQLVPATFPDSHWYVSVGREDAVFTELYLHPEQLRRVTAVGFYHAKLRAPSQDSGSVGEFLARELYIR